MRPIYQITFTVLTTLVSASLLAGCPSGGCRYQKGCGPQNPRQQVINQNNYPVDSFNQEGFEGYPNAYNSTYPQQSHEMMNQDFNPRQFRGYPNSPRSSNFSNQELQESVYYNSFAQPNYNSGYNSSYSNANQFNRSGSYEQENLHSFAAPESRTNYRLRSQPVDPRSIRDQLGDERSDNFFDKNQKRSNDFYQPSYSTDASYRPNYQDERNYPMDKPSYSSNRPNNFNSSNFESNLQNQEANFNNSLPVSDQEQGYRQNLTETNENSRHMNRAYYNN